MNEKKIAFIICTNSDLWYSECVKYLNELDIPEGFEAEILQIIDAKSMAAGYNEGMHSSDAKYKIYMHHDVFIVRRDFLKTMVDIFIRHPEVGILGVVGSDKIVTNACYWDKWNLGKVYACDNNRGVILCGPGMSEAEITYAKAIDGMIMMTQYDVEWREDLFQKWDFYDISQCFEFLEKGYLTAVVKEQNIGCMHDCGHSKLTNYDEGREVFCNEYSKYGFDFQEKIYPEDAEAREEVFRDFLGKLNTYLETDIVNALALADAVCQYYPRDNRMSVIRNAFEIYKAEQGKDGCRFVCLGDTWEELFDKYTEYRLLLHRIEFASDSVAINKLIYDLMQGRISEIAVNRMIDYSCCDVEKVHLLLWAGLDEKATDTMAKEEVSTQENPLVSVIMSSYNHAEFVGETIESVLNQTYKNIEFIVCDDASTDGTVEKLLQYENEIDEIHLFDQNQGGCGEFLCERAKGEYIAVVNSDDVWCLDKLEKQIKVLQEHPEAVGCFTWCEMIDEEGAIENAVNVFNVTNRSKEEWMNYFYFSGNCFSHQSVVMKREIYCKYRKQYIERFRQVPDFYMWINLVQEHEVIMLEEELVKVRNVKRSGRRNVSAPIRDNILRNYNEEAYIWYKIISEMDEAFFVNAFKEQLMEKNVQGKVGIMCEKFFVLLRAKVEFFRIAAIFYYYEHYPEMKDELETHYGFTNKDMHKLVVNIGPGKYMQ